MGFLEILQFILPSFPFYISDICTTLYNTPKHIKLIYHQITLNFWNVSDSVNNNNKINYYFVSVYGCLVTINIYIYICIYILKLNYNCIIFLPFPNSYTDHVSLVLSLKFITLYLLCPHYYLCVQIYVYICVQMHVYAYIYKCMHTYICAYIFTFICICMYLCMYIKLMRIYIYICIYFKTDCLVLNNQLGSLS